MTTDLTGRRFGKLEILGPADRGLALPATRGGWWLARCDCGHELTAPAEGFLAGRITSCGRPTPEARLRREEQLDLRPPVRW